MHLAVKRQEGDYLIIYEAYTLDDDYYNPLSIIGIYNDFEVAKKEVEKASEYVETLHVDVLELKGNKFEVIERWTRYKPNPNWEKEEI